MCLIGSETSLWPGRSGCLFVGLSYFLKRRDVWLPGSYEPIKKSMSIIFHHKIDWAILQLDWIQWRTKSYIQHSSSSSSPKERSCFFCLSFFLFFSLTLPSLLLSSSFASRFFVGFLKTILALGSTGFSASSKKKECIQGRMSFLLWSGNFNYNMCQ